MYREDEEDGVNYDHNEMYDDNDDDNDDIVICKSGQFYVSMNTTLMTTVML